MSWELRGNFSAEYFTEIRARLELWPKAQLVEAIAFTMHEREPGHPRRQLDAEFLAKLTEDVLAEIIMEMIEETNTTSPGGHQVYIDRAGRHVVEMRD